MKYTKEQLTPTKIKLNITADSDMLETVKNLVVNSLGKDIKLAGFRAGKVPAGMLEKNLDQNQLQSEFINQAVASLYEQAVIDGKIRVVGQPTISVTKFVPYSSLEFTAETDAVGDIKLGDYKKLGLKPEKVVVSAADVTKVLNDLAVRSAKKTDKTGAAINGDEVNLDFEGVDGKSKEAIAGADAKAYNLVIGSKSFIAGFEDQLVGLKAKDKKSFTLTFPKDYAVNELKSRQVSFDVVINSVKQLDRPKIDDKFATTVGPFKTLAELKADIKLQLTSEKQQAATEKYDNALLTKLADLSQAAIPDSLIDEEINRLEEDEKRNIVYRGQTWQEHLSQEGLSEQQHRDKQRPLAGRRVKTGLILGIIADKEDITVTDLELETRLNLLKKNYQDPAMQEELSRPESIREIRSRMMIEKTIDKIREINSTKSSN